MEKLDLSRYDDAVLRFLGNTTNFSLQVSDLKQRRRGLLHDSGRKLLSSNCVMNWGRQ